VRTLLTRITGEGKSLSFKEINARIGELLKASIKSEGVINLFSNVDMEFSMFDPKFLQEIFKMKERNLAIRGIEANDENKYKLWYTIHL